MEAPARPIGLSTSPAGSSQCVDHGPDPDGYQTQEHDGFEAKRGFHVLVPPVEDAECTRALTLRMSRDMFTFLPGQRPVRMRRVELWFEAQMCDGVRNHEIEFVPERDCECDEDNEECCERYFLTCVASEDWPCLFHGVIEYPFPFLCDGRPIAIGAFLFPESVGVVYRAYLVCSYEAGPPKRCLPGQPVCESDCAVLC